ncbi:MAG TPA: sigma 54-interacting transcriptional regulator [Smithellaceae bacterium]|mgnify:CR=1 FL=1|nr:sigma 54-interacting transcriptional regulator [Smithellaceae bacterium]HRS89581.1 sigma 54-interacting transcriptional regulator [Smithellaceae bacterium]HRV26358.1 sigma 54-interacting transcriptional regulator [Smithellaceae bacterium]
MSQTEVKQRQNESFFHAWLDGSDAGLFVVQNGALVRVNQIFCETLGYKNPEELTNRKFLDVIHADDHAVARQELDRQGKGDDAQVNALRFLKKSGRPLWMMIKGLSSSYEGKPAFVGCLFNMTSLKNDVDFLRDSLMRYETIFNDVEVQLAEMDLQGNITFVNDAVCKMWKLPREELLGKNYEKYVSDETKKRFTEVYRNVFKTRLPVKNIVFEVKDREGLIRTIEKSISLARDAEGSICGFHIVTRDITQRKEAENKLIEHRSRLEAIFGSVKDAIITVDPGLRVIEANKSTENICGITVGQIVGKEFSQGSFLCSRACKEVLRQTLDSKAAVKEYRVECEHQQRQQQVVSVSSSPLRDGSGNFLGAVLVIRDITLLRDVERELRERNQFHNLVGRNRMMQNIYRLLEDLANLDTTVLITGESGTGKELVARALHYSGNRAFKPFTTVNCSALAESLLESELFGHVKGAFTGAIKDRQGRFETANGGTIFLDEIGDISALIQLKLLRVLQEKEFERVGESTSRKVDVRVIASTNKDLREKVQTGEFRQDLYYRLKVVEVVLPPLRKRLEDIPLLVDHFRGIFNERFSKNIEGISSEVLDIFMNYSWPGNVRELEHVMEHAFVLCHGGLITVDQIPPEIRNIMPSGHYIKHKSKRKAPREKEEIINALKKTGGNKAKAARLLGIGRRTIYRKIDDYQIEKEQAQ